MTTRTIVPLPLSRVAVTCAIAMALLGCSSSHAPTLDTTWAYFPSTSAGVTITFEADDTYVIQLLALTDVATSSDGIPVAATGNDEVEAGSFSNTPSVITFTPQTSSCPSAPPHTAAYSFSSNDLVLVLSGSAASFKSDANGTDGFTVMTGCFDSSGNFTAEVVAPLP